MSRQRQGTPMEVSMGPASGGGLGIFLRLRWAIAGFVLGFIAALTTGMGRGTQGPAEQIGEALDGGGHAVIKWVGKATGTEQAIETNALAGHVKERIGRDKGLDAEGIAVEPDAEEGSVALRGIVADPASKERAVNLARDTRGVRQVVDHLAITPKARVITTQPDEAAAPAVATRPRTYR